MARISGGVHSKNAINFFFFNGQYSLKTDTVFCSYEYMKKIKALFVKCCFCDCRFSNLTSRTIYDVLDKMDDLLRGAAGGGFPPQPIKSRHVSNEGEEDRYLAIRRDLDIIRQQTTSLTHTLIPTQPVQKPASRSTQESLDIQV